MGRFLTADTIVPDEADPQAYNRYSYVHNNPVNFTDSSGHCDDQRQCLVLARNVNFDWWPDNPPVERTRFFVDGLGYFDSGHIWRGYSYANLILDQINDAIENGGGHVYLASEYEVGEAFITSYWVSGDITEDQIIGIALGIYMDFEIAYETFQATLFDPSALSSFTPEDLPSDYIGFWAAVNGLAYNDIPTILKSYGEVTPFPVESIFEMDSYLMMGRSGTYRTSVPAKNHEFLPMDYAIDSLGNKRLVNVPWPNALQLTPIESGPNTWLPSVSPYGDFQLPQ